MTIEIDERIRSFLADEARRVTEAGPRLAETVATLAPRIEPRSAGPSRGLVLLVATGLLLLALTATLAVGSGLVRIPRLDDANPIVAPATEQQDAIARHVAALNSRDAAAFIDTFAPGAAFNSRGTFQNSSLLFANMLPAANGPLVDAFLAINDAWDFEGSIIGCEQLSGSDYANRYGLIGGRSDGLARCEVISRWTALSLEIRESWVYEFEGSDIRWWDHHVLDANPADRSLALGLDGLLDWESWLRSTDPGEAARLLNPRLYPTVIPCGRDEPSFAGETHSSPAPSERPCDLAPDDSVDRIVTSGGLGQGEEDWVVAGQRFMPNALVPYDPALAAEIEASITEFLRR